MERVAVGFIFQTTGFLRIHLSSRLVVDSHNVE